MKLIVGLGNPGKRYEKNRHNVGFMFVDYLLTNSKLKIQNSRLQFASKIIKGELEKATVYLIKPQTFMNNSGRAVVKFIKYLKINTKDLIIVHDDLDLRLGEYKMQFGKGPKIHNGILSVEKELKSKAFWRLRIGVDNRESENRVNGEKYVLEDFKKEELLVIQQVFEKSLCYLADTFL